MKKLICFLVLLPTLQLQAQKSEFSIKDLVLFTNIPTSKFSNYISRKGYKLQPDDSDETMFLSAYHKTSKDKTIEKLVGRYDKNDTAAIFYLTNSKTEFEQLKMDLEEDGFEHEPVDNANSELPSFYQRGNISIFPVIKKENEETSYGFTIERKKLPQANEILYAEDLLQLTSHQYLASVFGASNVKKDVFYFSEKEINKCSVLFPNTSLQVIFIWKDAVNNKDIAYIMIGGELRSKSSEGFEKAIDMNKWRSNQGIYLGMSLRELEKFNNGSIKFFGWETDQPGIVYPRNEGNINFRKIGVQLNCLDCNEDSYYSASELMNSTDVIQQNGRVYVSTLVLMPDWE
jgi:hypothetical protein